MDIEFLLNYFVHMRVPYPAPLEPHQIRLMALLPGKWHDPICCEVFRVSWEGIPKMLEYKALSYAWGFPSRNDPTLLVNDCPVKVTVNLEQVLRYERLLDKCAILWVDALCIDQQNNLERTFQVSQMGRIYSHATEVIVFLGNGVRNRKRVARRSKAPSQYKFENTSADDLHTAQFLSVWKAPHPPTNVTEYDIFCLLSIISRSQSLLNPFVLLRGIPEASLIAIFEGLRVMLTSRWWDRIWVVQEAVLAQAITLRYGNVSAPWGILTDAASFNSQQKVYQDISEVSVSDIKVLGLLSNVTDIDLLRQTWRKDEKPDLLFVLREFSNRKASDPRDKIYALLGLCNSKILLKPDYSQDTRTAYENATIDIINGSGSLDVLSGDVGRKNRQDLPSWVPDWSATFDEDERKRLRLLGKYKACGEVDSTYITANVGTHTIQQMTLFAASLKATNQSGALLPRCFLEALKKFGAENPSCSDVCETLVEFCDPLGHRPIGPFMAVGFLADDPKILEREKNDPTSGIEPNWDADGKLWASIPWVGGLRMRGKCVATVAHSFKPLYSCSDMESVSDSIIDWLKGVRQYFKEATSERDIIQEFVATLLSDVKSTPHGFERLNEEDKLPILHWFKLRIERRGGVSDKDLPTAEDLDAFTEVLQLSITKRAFFITDDQRMGLGPASIAEGDTVYVLPGGNLPFVLRQATPPDGFEEHVEVSQTFRLVEAFRTQL